MEKVYVDGEDSGGYDTKRLEDTDRWRRAAQRRLRKSMHHAYTRAA